MGETVDMQRLVRRLSSLGGLLVSLTGLPYLIYLLLAKVWVVLQSGLDFAAGTLN